MAPELFDDGATSTKASDIYSYAVVLWELGSKKIPLEEKALNDIQVYKIVSRGLRDEISADTPLAIAKLIGRCWDLLQENRPKMNEVVQLLRDGQQDYLKKVNIVPTNEEIKTPRPKVPAPRAQGAANNPQNKPASIPMPSPELFGGIFEQIKGRRYADHPLDSSNIWT